MIFWPFPLVFFSPPKKSFTFLACFNVLPFYGEMFHFLLSHLSTHLSSWLPWIFLFVFIFSFCSPCGDPHVAEWPEITEALFAVQAYWSFGGYSFPWHVYLWGSKDKGSDLILGSELCSAFVSYPFVYLPISLLGILFPSVAEFTKWWEVSRSQGGLFNRWRCTPGFMNCGGLFCNLCSSCSGLVLLLVIV